MKEPSSAGDAATAPKRLEPGTETFKKVIEEWNNTQKTFPTESIHELFVKQAALTPDACAVTFEGERESSLSYEELHMKTDAVSGWLRFVGVTGPDEFVGVFTQRTVNMVVGMLGVLKAGAAFVGLDPFFPKERLAYVMSDAKVSILLTDDDVVGEAEELIVRWHELQERENHATNIHVKILSITALCKNVDPFCFPEEKTTVSPNHLAYAMYTSGSTGKPKGVLIEHGNISNFLQALLHHPEFKPKGTSTLAVTTIGFDISLLELFLPLISGGCVHVVGESKKQDGEALRHLLDKLDVKIMQATPATWNLLLETDWQGSRDIVLLCGGEAMPLRLGEHLRTRCHQLWNMYGPTEATIWSTMKWIADPLTAAPTVGTPMYNNTCYVLDTTTLQPVLPGEKGELFIGGLQIARGYNNRPDLTGERFVDDPFFPQYGRKMYRTGDLSCHLPSGEIMCLGRIDFQVKLNGYRIELGEIESVLCLYEMVREAVVVVRGDPKMIYAFLLQETKKKLTFKELQQHVSRHCPHYMVPNAFIVLDDYPRLPNKKVNRKELEVLPITPKMKIQDEEPSAMAERDLSPVERKLVDICKSLLGISTITLTTNFYSVGGTSLFAMRLHNKIKREMNYEMPVLFILQNGTIGDLAKRMEADLPPPAGEPTSLSSSNSNRRLLIRKRIQSKKQVSLSDVHDDGPHADNNGRPHEASYTSSSPQGGQPLANSPPFAEEPLSPSLRLKRAAKAADMAKRLKKAGPFSPATSEELDPESTRVSSLEVTSDEADEMYEMFVRSGAAESSDDEYKILDIDQDGQLAGMDTSFFLGNAPSWQDSDSALFPLNSATEGPAVFFFHPAGGWLFPYYLLVKYMGDCGRLFGLQEPCLNVEREPFRTVEEMTDFYVNLIVSVDRRGPCHLIGWSLGGYICYEAALRLSQLGVEVASAMVIDQPAKEMDPGGWFLNLVHGTPLVQLTFSMRHLKYKMARKPVKAWFYRVMMAVMGGVNFRRERGDIEAILKAGVEVDGETIRLMKILDAHLKATEAYIPHPYDGNLYVLHCVEDANPRSLQGIMSWKSIAPNTEFHPIPGNHYNCIKDPQAEPVAEVIMSCIREATQRLQRDRHPSVRRDSAPEILYDRENNKKLITRDFTSWRLFSRHRFIFQSIKTLPTALLEEDHDIQLHELALFSNDKPFTVLPMQTLLEMLTSAQASKSLCLIRKCLNIPCGSSLECRLKLDVQNFTKKVKILEEVTEGMRCYNQETYVYDLLPGINYVRVASSRILKNRMLKITLLMKSDTDAPLFCIQLQVVPGGL